LRYGCDMPAPLKCRKTPLNSLTGKAHEIPIRSTQDSKSQLVDQALEIWQPRASRALTREDARQIVENISGFFRILLEWDAKERRTVTPMTMVEPRRRP